MPGLIFSCNHSSIKLQAALNSLHDNRFQCNEINLHTESIYCGTYANENYPIQVFRSGNRIALLEGMIYPHQQDIGAYFFKHFFHVDGFRHESINEWVRLADGEFVILLYDGDLQQLLIVNDCFGRLPLYFSKNENQQVVAREIRFVLAMQSNLKPDNIGRAQNLLFGFPLRNRTLWENIERFPPNAQLLYDLQSKQIEIKNYFSLHGDHLKHKKNTAPSDLLGLLKSALASRMSVLPNSALSLSGGLDSRLIAALLADLHVEIPLITYDDAAGTAKKDVEAALIIGLKVNMNHLHTVLPLDAPEEIHFMQLMQYKNGLNGLDMAFLLPYLEYFKQKNLTQITGDGGDKVLADLRPLTRCSTEKHLIDYIIRKHASMPIERACNITGISNNTLRQSIAETLHGYGTTSPENKHIHFMVRERAMKWLFEGEDRNRYFSWTTTPYYNPAFFEAAMQLQMKEKAGGKVFLELFKLLPGQLETIVNPNWNTAIDDQKKIRSIYFKQKLLLRMPSFIAKHVRNKKKMMEFAAFEHSQIIENLLKMLPEAHVLHKIKQQSFTEENWYRLLTQCALQQASL